LTRWIAAALALLVAVSLPWFGAAAQIPAVSQTGETHRWARGIEGQRKADLGNGYYLNPIMAVDHPDPSVLKDGADYYMVLAEGGTAGPPTGHVVVAARSTSIEGRWENSPYNPILRTESATERGKGHHPRRQLAALVRGRGSCVRNRSRDRCR
jgi:hypothetical protein